MTLGKRIRSMRKMRFMTMDELAEAVGISAPTIYAYEQDQREPRASTVVAMAKVFGVSTDKLLTGEEYDAPRE